jgi:hypothetical protein
VAGEFQRWFIEYVVRPPVGVIGFVGGKIYDLFFLKGEIERSGKRDAEFESEVRRSLPFLFDEYGGRIVPDEKAEYPRPFDYALAFVFLEDLRFCFFSGDARLSSLGRALRKG